MAVSKGEIEFYSPLELQYIMIGKEVRKRSKAVKMMSALDRFVLTS